MILHIRIAANYYKLEQNQGNMYFYRKLADYGFWYLQSLYKRKELLVFLYKNTSIHLLHITHQVATIHHKYSIHQSLLPVSYRNLLGCI